MKRIALIISFILIASILCSCANVGTDSPEATPQLTPEPTPNPTPDPYESYFTDKEQVYISQDYSVFRYMSSDLFVQVVQHENSVPQRWWVAEVIVRGEQTLKDGYTDGVSASMARTRRAHVNDIARKYSAVLAVNGDFYVDTANNPLGIVIRGGKVIYDKNQADSLALMPSGRLLPVAKGEMSAQELTDLGCNTCWSFGPILVRLGKMTDGLAKHRLFRRNPRCGVGMIEPNHYILIVCEGRRPGVSKGATLTEFAQMFLDEGCYTAYNMDGGISSNISFLGQPLTYHPTEGVVGGSPEGRSVPDIIYIGTSDLCANEGDKVIRYSLLIK